MTVKSASRDRHADSLKTLEPGFVQNVGERGASEPSKYPGNIASTARRGGCYSSCHA